MPQSPKVSVIMPVYNGERFVKEAIESVLTQTFRDFEFIVVDDGSTDKTREILQKYCPKIIILSQNNQGAPSARNLALRHVKGEYIAFIDADDAWLPERLNKQVPILDQHPETGLVFGNGLIIHFDGSPVIQKPKTFFDQASPARGLVFSKLIKANFIPQSSVLVRRTCFRKLGNFLKESLVTDDYHKWLEISLHFQIDFIDDIIFRYTLHQNNISRDRFKKYKSLLLVFNNLIKSATDKDIIKLLKKKRFKIRNKFVLIYLYTKFSKWTQFKI